VNQLQPSANVPAPPIRIWSRLHSNDGGLPLDIRLFFIHRDLARQSFPKLLSWDFDKLITAHGVCIETNAKAFVERAF